jgi:hypothetical protein
MNKRVDYSPYLKPGEVLEEMDKNLLRKRKFDHEQRMADPGLERLREQRAEEAEEREAHEKLGLLYFSETTRLHPAETIQDEIACHRRFLRAFGDQPDVQEHETLRQLARRTWIRWLRGQAETGGKAWAAAFNPKTKEFEYHGFHIPNGSEPGYFESTWRPPADCKNGEEDQPIDWSVLPDWTFRKKIVPEPKPPAPLAPPPTPVTFEVPRFTLGWGYSTVNGPELNALAPVAQNYLNGGGKTFSSKGIRQ